MTDNGLRLRLEKGRPVYRLYKQVRNGEPHEGLVSIFPDNDRYAVRWEECPAGHQYDEHLYTRDGHHRFGTVDEVIQFVASQGWHATEFSPR